MTKAEEIAQFMRTIIANEVGLAITDIDLETDFFAYGLDSINAIYLLELLEDKYDLKLSPLYFWDYPTISSLSNQIHSEIQVK